MGFNLDSWKAQIAGYFKSHAPLIKQVGADTLYGLLAAGALLPVVAAAQQGDVMVGSVLAQVLGGVGVELIANLIQDWKDKTDAEIAQGVLESTQKDTELRQAVDILLEKLEVVSSAQQALSDADKQWFVEILQAELKKVGSSITISVGDLSNISNSLINIVGNQTNIYAAPDPEAQKRAVIAQARTRYLTHLRKFCQSLPLSALGGDEGSELGITLDDVYIELDTTASFDFISWPSNGSVPKPDPDVIGPPDSSLAGLEMNKKPPLPVLQAAGQNPHMVLLGDPGAGKSTFVRKLVGWLAGAALGDGEPPKGFPAAGLPLLINLRDLAPRLAGVKLDDMPAEKQQKKLVAAFTDLVQAELKTTQAEALQDDLLAGLSGNGLLVLDGLDEVPFALRRVVRQAVFAVLKTFQPVRVIITCRIRSYQDDFSQSDFKSYTVKPLDEKKITGFASTWYHRQRDLGHIVPQDAEDDLARAATGDDLRELSSNPMMLTTMAIIHQKQTRLPDQRVKLYKEAVDILLRRWQQHKQGELSPSEELAKFLKNDTRLRPAMYRLAYAAHCARCQDKKSTTTDLPRGDALLILEDIKYLGDLKLAQEFLDYVDQRAGLLVGRGGQNGAPAAYIFPHRTFQEYLAGCHVLELREYNREILSRAAEGVDWSLATQLAAEELYYNREGKNALLDLAYWLRQRSSMESPQHQRVGLWAANQTLILGSAVTEDGTAGRKHLEKLPNLMVNLLGGSLTPIERAEAGNILARLGDPRFRADAFYLPDEPLLGFVHIPAGRFLMGSDPKKDQNYQAEELPQHEVELGEYYIARYPVTVAQFIAFLANSGYKDAYYGLPRGLPNHPVVWVTWYDAMAYCDWLTAQLPNLPDLPAELQRGWRVTLPSEAEWERAARGTDGRIYPWGTEFDSDKANTTGIGGTSAVGCFPSGTSPAGLLDASGNVWEWTRSCMGDYPYPEPGSERAAREGVTSTNRGVMVARGGSWDYHQGYARCACRYGDFPDGRDDYRGFRVSLCAAPCKGSPL